MLRTSLLAMSVLALVAVACAERVPSELPVVEELIGRTTLLRIACLDANGDGRVNAADGTAATLPDLNGDGLVDDVDAEIVRGVDIALADGRPAACDTEVPEPDWQFGPAPTVDCAAGEAGLILFAIGGGKVDLSLAENAAGVRWMMAGISDALTDAGVSHQLVSVAPQLNGTESGHADAEAWSMAYLLSQLSRRPCTFVVLYGHSHGATTVTAVTAVLERAGYGERVLLAALIDRVDAFYFGDAESMPQTALVFNAFQTNGKSFTGTPIDQPNVENWDASGEKGPKNGERGGRLRPVIHTSIDNSEAVRDRLLVQIVVAACGAGLCAEPE